MSAAAAIRSAATLGAVQARLCEMLIASEDRLNALDRAIGDGDHGSNMARAAQTLAAMADELEGLAPGEALVRAGKAVVMSLGAASGPLYGSLLLDMGKALPETPAQMDWARAFSAGVASIGRRGRSSEGDKTMLDVLAPSARAFEAESNAGVAGAVRAMIAAARQGLEQARPLKAARGRAAYVGDRAIGQDDPGATSALLCVETVGGMLLEYCE